MPSRRQNKLDAVVSRLQLRYGPQAIRRSTPVRPAAVPHLSTTFAALDAALGLGGLPRGRLTEIVGPATSGKLTLAAKALSAAHREHAALVAWIDLSHTCDPDYLHRCGLDLDRLLVVHPEAGSDALAITLHLVEGNAVAALVFDGIADLISSDEAGQAPARSLEPALAGTLERLGVVVTHTETAVLFLTEPRAQFRTLAHLAAIRLEIRRERWITRGADVRGYEAEVVIVKNKLGQSGATVPVRITFNGTVRSDATY